MFQLLLLLRRDDFLLSFILIFSFTTAIILIGALPNLSTTAILVLLPILLVSRIQLPMKLLHQLKHLSFVLFYYTYLIFRYFLRVKIVLLFFEELIGQERQVRRLPQVYLEFMNVFPRLRQQLIDYGDGRWLEPQTEVYRVGWDETT
jgi:hypothetical protein